MKNGILLLWLLVCSVAVNSQSTQHIRSASALPAVPANQNTPVSTLPIRRVILYSNGVAYIERRGTVTGNAEIDLSFKQSQVDDVLKSMVVLDLGQGKIGAVSYNSSAPASARTSEISFNVSSKSEDTDEASGGLANVLMQLQGANVLVTTRMGTTTGSILTVEKKKNVTKKKDGEETSLPVNYSLVIASPTSELSSFDLADIKSVKLLDEGTKQDVKEFSSATASTRRRDAKTITVSSLGSGTREMVVSYTVAAPIWKTTYRVVLDKEGKPFFQGWAIVDNVSEEDWKGVQLSLISGSPVSFIQNLQKPLYRYRPIIPIPDDLNLSPQIYDPEVGVGEGFGSGSSGGVGYGSGGGMGAGVSASDAPPPMKAFSNANNNFIVSSGYAGSSLSDAIVDGKSGVQTAASGSEIGDLFEYKIDQPVTIDKSRSALIPIVQTKMDGERVSIFREAVEDSKKPDGDGGEESNELEASRKANPRPMSGLLLKNVTAMTFEGGSMTVLDGDAYAGEALMERLKPKEQRLISFAQDLGTLIRIEQKEDREPAKLVKVVDGVFQVHYFKSEKKIYHLSNQTDKPKVVYIEHPIKKNWVLSETGAKPDYTTARFYRFRVEMQPFDNKDITVGENLGMMDKYELTSLSPKDLDVFVYSHFIDDATRARLAKLIDLRMQINQINTKLAAAGKENEEITADQARFRENIEALAKTAEAKQLITRYIAKANDQETRLEQMRKDKQAMLDEKDKLERELAIEIKNFEIS
ncbi:MAG: hypothetical protein ABI999_03955 [Acidobacteriota bacterium]